MMQLEYNNAVYSSVRGSDLKRDGMFSELNRNGKLVAEVFFSDSTQEFTVSLFADCLPLTVLEKFCEEARAVLRPMSS